MASNQDRFYINVRAIRRLVRETTTKKGYPKMMISREFLLTLNEVVGQLAEICVDRAYEEGKRRLRPHHLSVLQELQFEILQGQDGSRSRASS